MSRVKRAASIGMAMFAFACVAIGWEVAVRYGGFPPKLVPGLGAIWEAFLRLSTNGVLLDATKATLFRLVSGFMVAAGIGVPLGIFMGRHQWVEDTVLPTITFFYPIPGLAYAPLFVLWFGLGDVPTILLVGFSSCLVVTLNTWKGVRTVNPIWVRSAQVMGASGRTLFRRVILPGALPYILIGLRLGVANAWRILIAIEMIMSVERGLGWMIFGAQTFLNTDVMLATIAVIGAIGMLIENQIFQRVERRTIVRWGMVDERNA